MIRKLTENDFAEAVTVICSSFMTVADEFNITRENAHAFTAFATDENRLRTWMFEQDRPMYGYFDNGRMVGYYNLMIKDKECELGSLSVLPEYRHIKNRFPCIADCDMCGLCKVFHSKDPESAYDDYIKGMSKVNYYLDSKQKARHRQRRYYTAHKKLSRACKSERGEYSRFYGYCGYFVERQKERIIHKTVKDPSGRTVFHYNVFEPVGREIFQVRHRSINAKYKIDYDIAWTIT